MSHVVTAAAVQVQAGRRVFTLFAGSGIPDGVSEETLDALERKGLIEKVKPEAKAKGKKPADDESA